MKSVAACFLALFISMALVSCVGYENNIINTEKFKSDYTNQNEVKEKLDSDHTNQNEAGEKGEFPGSEAAEKDESSTYLFPCL